MKRVFIAIKIYADEDFKVFIREIRSNLKDEKIRWVDLHNLHVTLRFLGETGDDILPEISDLLKEIAFETRSFRITVKGTGVFRSISWPRVLWAGLEDNQNIQGLKYKIDEKLGVIGYPSQDNDFIPHLTLGRMKRINDRDKLREVVNTYEGIPLLVQDVESMIFYESRLSVEGPEYIPIEEYFFTKHHDRGI